MNAQRGYIVSARARVQGGVGFHSFQLQLLSGGLLLKKKRERQKAGRQAGSKQAVGSKQGSCS